VLEDVNNVPLGVLHGQLTEFTRMHYKRPLFHLCALIAAAAPSLECIHHYKDVSTDGRISPTFTFVLSPQWVCKVVRSKADGVVNQLNVAAKEYQEDRTVRSGVGYSYMPAKDN